MEEGLGNLRLDEDKETMNVVFIGHVDAGKSTLGGNILVLTGNVDARTLEKFQQESKELNRESWYLSWALDTSQEERNKGITVEVGRAVFETAKKRYMILDAPGHKNYVPNMISGAAQADVALLVISARKGEFETGFEKGGQTREHVLLAKTLGVKRLVVVINKMDDPTVQWQQSRFDEITGKLQLYLRNVGFTVGKDATFLPISAFTGENIVTPMTTCPWYNGPSLLSYLDGLPAWERATDGPFRMPISEKGKDMGTLLSGKIESGKVTKGDQLLVMPNKRAVEVTAVYFEDIEKKAAKAGEIVKIKVKGIEEEEVSVGFVVCSVERPLHVVSRFRAKIHVLDTKNIISAGYKAILHVHTLAEEVTLVKFIHQIDPKTNEKMYVTDPRTQKVVPKRPRFLKQGEVAVVVVQCAGPVCIETYKDSPQLGRFSLRDEGKTVALGVVTKLCANDEDAH